jgi:hypothetical protein
MTMKRAKYLIVIAVVALLLAAGVLPAAAQSGGPVSAQVDRTSLTTDDRLTLVVTVDSTAGDASQPMLPALDGFQVLGSSRGSQMSIINGNMSSQTYYQYTLQPTQPGDWVIPPVTVTAGGNTYATEPMAVRVSQGTGVPSASNQPSSAFPSLPGFPSLGNLGRLGSFGNLGNLGSLGSLLSPPTSPTTPSAPRVPVEPSPAPAALAGQDFFLEATVDNQTPYQGQQVLYKVRFYQAVDGLGGLDYRPPSFTGFWSEQRPEQGEYMIQAAGRNYRVTELTSVLFPTVVGEVTIDPATLAVPGEVLSVKSLPDNAPPGFTGAVGRFDIEATADKVETKVNDTVNWRVMLSGEGNVENLPDPLWNESGQWRAFDSQASVDSRFENGIQLGSRVYDRVLVPTEAGELTLPAVVYSYFDPELAEYVTVESQPLTVHVVPDGSNRGNAPTLPAGGTAITAPVAPAVSAEIRPMKEASASWTTGSPWLTDKAGFWLLWAIPLLLLAGHYGWQRRQSNRLNSVSLRRSKQAASKAHRALREAGKDAATDLYQACGQVLTTYLAEKLDRSLTGMTQSGVVQLLRESGVEADLADRVERCLMLSEMGRYAPADVYKAGDELIAETLSLVDELDKVL